MKELVFFANTLEIGGLERALVTLLNRLAAEEGLSLTLILEEKRGSLLAELDGRVKLREYRTSHCRFAPLRKLINLARWRLWALKNRDRYDFACAYCTYSTMGSRLARAASANNCLYVHNDYTEIYPKSEDFYAYFRRLHAENFRRLVFVSNESRARFDGRFPALADRTSVINNLVESEQIRKLSRKPCPFTRREGETVLLFLGRLDEGQKRLSRLLEAFSLAREKRHDLRLLLVGDGPDRALCETLIQNYDLSDCVDMPGAQANPYPWLAAADCLVLASDYEGFPVVYYEALALGRDIITTVPVSDELLDMREHAIIAQKTPGSLAEAMAAYVPSERPPLDMEAVNRARIREFMQFFR